jgi:hypothetical protein
MKPTVGRIVYYKSYGTPNGEYKPEQRAAIITGVVDDETVHLCVLNPTGMFFNLNVKRGQNSGQWDWIPYQKGQAEKTDEVTESLNMVNAAQNVIIENLLQRIENLESRVNELPKVIEETKARKEAILRYL